MHMRISWFDAIDLFSMGGYLDKTTGRYIPSRGYLEKRRRIFQNMEIPDYDKIELEPERYIAAPHINTFNVNAKCAMDLGLTKDELLKMGCSSDMYKCEMLSAEKAERILEKGYGAEERKALERIEASTQQMGKYETYIEKTISYRQKIIERWLKAYGIEIADDQH